MGVACGCCGLYKLGVEDGCSLWVLWAVQAGGRGWV